MTEPASNNFLYDWTRDGQQFTFQGTPNGLPEIFLMDIASGQVQQLTDLGGVTTAPSWSPDSSSLAYFEHTEEQIAANPDYLGAAEGTFIIYDIATDTKCQDYPFSGNFAHEFLCR